MLGERCEEGKLRGGAFSDSGIESVRIPSTLRAIEACTFADCKKLKSMELSEGLAEIGPAAFAESGLESIVLPASTRIVYAEAFTSCEQLRSVRLNEGLEALGKKWNKIGRAHV